VGLENDDRMAAIDTRTNRLLQEVPIGQAPQAILYVPEAVDNDDTAPNLIPLGAAASAIHLELRSLAPDRRARSSVSLFDQGLVQVLQAAVTGLMPKAPYVLALAPHADGSGKLEPLAAFNTNAAGAAIVNTAGPIRQLMHAGTDAPSRFLVVAPGTSDSPSAAVQVQTP
jgi:hypothetical protein